jgi:predicted nucleic acid-binding protein
VIYLLDSDTLSNLLRPAPPLVLMRRLDATPSEDQSTPSITVGELYYGARRREGAEKR